MAVAHLRWHLFVYPKSPEIQARSSFHCYRTPDMSEAIRTLTPPIAPYLRILQTRFVQSCFLRSNRA